MNREPDTIGILRLREKRADGCMPVSLILLLCGCVRVLVEQPGLGVPERTGVFALLAAIVLAAIVRRAVGSGVARRHRVVSGIGRQSPGIAGSRPSRRP